MPDMLDLYRRHVPDCPNFEKGSHATNCQCPIWAYGTVPTQHGERRIRQAMKLRDWSRAVRRADQMERKPAEFIEPTRVRKACDSYLADCRSRKLAESTITSYSKTLEHLAEFCSRKGVWSIEECGLPVFSDFRSSRDVAGSTGRKERETLVAFSAFCVEHGWLEQNYAKKLKPPKQQALPTMPYTQHEVEKILSACDQIEDDNPNTRERTRLMARARCLVMLYSGLRISDTVKLERQRVDMRTGQMRLRTMKTGVPLYVRLSREAVESLQELPREGEYFFWSGRSKLATAVGNARRSIQRVLAIAGVKGHPHRFRDTFSVRLLEGGDELRTVQLLLGHTSIRTTEKHYAPWVKSMQRILDAATAKLDFVGRKKLRRVG
jgi:integrase/recombinase XerD